jgi:hypothetical protein
LGIFETSLLRIGAAKANSKSILYAEAQGFVLQITASSNGRGYAFDRGYRDLAGMGNGYADTIYVVIASKDEQTEFWAAATPRHKAATEVQQFLPHGWIANFTGWRFSAEKSTDLKMPANSVRKLKSSR